MASRTELAVIALIMIMAAVAVLAPRRRRERDEAAVLAERFGWSEAQARPLVRRSWRDELGLTDPAPLPLSPDRVRPVTTRPAGPADASSGAGGRVVEDLDDASCSTSDGWPSTPALDRLMPAHECTYQPKGWRR